jgi:hypothetical protein
MVCISDIEDSVSSHDCLKISQQLASDWEKVARLLEPQPLDGDRIVALRKLAQDPKEQAKMLLDIWSKDLGAQANHYCLIKTLIEAEKKAVAESVFGDLAKSVGKVSISKPCNQYPVLLSADSHYTETKISPLSM